jgi:predicted RNase H-like nuclease
MNVSTTFDDTAYNMSLLASSSLSHASGGINESFAGSQSIEVIFNVAMVAATTCDEIIILKKSSQELKSVILHLLKVTRR